MRRDATKRGIYEGGSTYEDKVIGLPASKLVPQAINNELEVSILRSLMEYWKTKVFTNVCIGLDI